MGALKMSLFILALYVSLWLPYAVVGEGYLALPFGVIALAPILSVYLFDYIGVPGLLQNNGQCGWGWCAPTLFGWVFTASFWMLMVYGVSLGLARLGGKS